MKPKIWLPATWSFKQTHNIKTTSYDFDFVSTGFWLKGVLLRLDCCQLQAKVCAWGTGLTACSSLPRKKVWLCELTVPPWLTWDVKQQKQTNKTQMKQIQNICWLYRGKPFYWDNSFVSIIAQTLLLTNILMSRDVISNNVAFWQVNTLTSLWSLLLSLETPNVVQSVA